MKGEKEVEQLTAVLVKQIAQNVKTLRTKKGLTQAAMVRFGFNSRWYQRLESGNHIPTIPTIPTLVKLAQAFNVNIADLLQ